MKVTRRRSLKLVGSIGLASGIVGCVGGGYGSGDGNTMRIGTAYAEDSPVPLAQQEFVENLDGEVDDAIDVELYPGGQLAVGPDLGSRVQSGSAEVGSLSYSNISPYAEMMDLINLPYFAGDFESFLNLITSDVWEEMVHEDLRDSGFEPLFTWMSAPRAIGLGSEEPVLEPDDIQGMSIRIPASDMAELSWDLLGANAVPVDWGETAQAVEEGVVDGLHVSLPPLAAYGFEDTLDHITVIDKVMDVGIYVMNREWYQNLDSDLQDGVENAAEDTFVEQLELIEEMVAESEEIFNDAGTEIHRIDDEQVQTWEEKCGYQLDDWTEWKTDLAGDMETFERFEEATDEQSEYDAPSVS